MDLDVTAVVITYHSADHVVEAIRALEEAMEGLEGEIIIVDNASTDGTVERAREVLRSGRVIANSDNLGYAKAANQGIRAARGRFTMVMNDDARIDGTSLRRLLEVAAEDPRIGLVGPRIVGVDGSPMPAARRTFPGLAEEMRRLVPPLRGNARYPAGSDPVDVHWLVGACVLGPTEVLRSVGGFNESFFLYGEDIDLGRRLRELGYRSVTVPDATCVHVGGVATDREYDDTARSRRQMDGRSVYYRLWLRRPTRVLVYLLRALGLHGQPERFRAFFRLAVSDGPSLRSRRFPPPLRSDRAA